MTFLIFRVAKSVDVDEVSEEFGKVESLVYAEAEALFIIPREEFNKLPQPYSPTIAI